MPAHDEINQIWRFETCPFEAATQQCACHKAAQDEMVVLHKGVIKQEFCTPSRKDPTSDPQTYANFRSQHTRKRLRVGDGVDSGFFQRFLPCTIFE